MAYTMSATAVRDAFRVVLHCRVRSRGKDRSLLPCWVGLAHREVVGAIPERDIRAFWLEAECEKKRNA